LILNIILFIWEKQRSKINIFKLLKLNINFRTHIIATLKQKRSYCVCWIMPHMQKCL